MISMHQSGGVGISSAGEDRVNVCPFPLPRAFRVLQLLYTDFSPKLRQAGVWEGRNPRCSGLGNWLLAGTHFPAPGIAIQKARNSNLRNLRIPKKTPHAGKTSTESKGIASIRCSSLQKSRGNLPDFLLPSCQAGFISRLTPENGAKRFRI